MDLQVHACGKHESLRFIEVENLNHEAILGIPWLAKVNPHIDWAELAIHAHNVALGTLIPACVPHAYVDFADIFENRMANCLPKHTPFDCAIEVDDTMKPPYDHNIACQIMN